MPENTNSLISLECVQEETYQPAVSELAPFVIEQLKINLTAYQSLAEKVGAYAADCLMPGWAGLTEGTVHHYLKEAKSLWVASLQLKVPVGLVSELDFLFEKSANTNAYYQKVHRHFVEKRYQLGEQFFDENQHTFATCEGSYVYLQIPFNAVYSNRSYRNNVEDALLGANGCFSKLHVQNCAPVRMSDMAHMLTHANSMEDACIQGFGAAHWIHVDRQEALLSTITSKTPSWSVLKQNGHLQLMLKLNSLHALNEQDHMFDEVNKTFSLAIGRRVSLEELRQRGLTEEEFRIKTNDMLTYLFDKKSMEGQDPLKFLALTKPAFVD